MAMSPRKGGLDPDQLRALRMAAATHLWCTQLVLLDHGLKWIYTRSNGVWVQQGGKLIGSGAVGNADQGVSVALSGDGNTAIVGGYGDDSFTGAAWVYIRSGGVWTQQGNKLVGTGAVGTPN